MYSKQQTFNIKLITGTCKGLIGECLFQSTRKNCYITNFFPFKLLLRKYDSYLTKEQKCFLEEHWLTIDAIEFRFEENSHKIILYEIKAKNIERLKYRICLTQNVLQVHAKGKDLGFESQLAQVLFLEKGNFVVRISSFEKIKFWIDTRNRYNKLLYKK